MTNIDLLHYMYVHSANSPNHVIEVLKTLHLLNEAIVKHNENGLPDGLPGLIRYYISRDMPCSGPESTHLIISEKYGPMFYLQLPPYCYVVPVNRGSSFEIKLEMKTIYRQIASRLCRKKDKATRSVLDTIAQSEDPANTAIIHVGFDNGIINIL